MISRLIASKDFLYTVTSFWGFSGGELQNLLDHIIWGHRKSDLEVDRVCLLLPSWLGQCIYRLGKFDHPLISSVPLVHPLHLLLQGHVQHHDLKLWWHPAPNQLSQSFVIEDTSYCPITSNPLPLSDDILAHCFETFLEVTLIVILPSTPQLVCFRAFSSQHPPL